MIQQLRIDERLIHGQITTQWSRVLDIDTIVVANDAAAENTAIQKIMMMGAPAGKKVFIKHVDETIKLLSDPRAEKMKVFIIVDNPQDAIKCVKELNITSVNVANFNKKKGDNKVRFTDHISAVPEDAEALKELVSVCVDVHSQMLPSTPKIDLEKLLKE